MLELGKDVFTSRLATDEWEPDPEVGGEMHLLGRRDGLEAGLSRFREDTELTWELPASEVLLVLEGSVEIELDEGPALSLSEGEMAFLPGGSMTHWRISAPFLELWILNR